MGNSKKIGNNYEREFSKKLSAWLTGDATADVCWRDIGSGSRFTTRKKSGMETARKGDIVCTDPKYQKFFDLFFIDTKTCKDSNMFFINEKNMKSNHVLQEWIKVSNDCPINMTPLMPIKVRDRITPEFIVLPLCLPIYADNRIMVGINNFGGKKIRFQIVSQDDFFKNNLYESLIKDTEVKNESISKND